MKRFICVVLTVGCLDPAADDAVDVSDEIQPADANPANAFHVEEAAMSDPELAAKVEQFATQVAYLRGFADGEPVAYFNIDGPNSEIIAPFFQVVRSTGGVDENIGLPIIDVLPGDTGYTPWWRVFRVEVTEKFAGEKFWSRAAIDAGVSLGLLKPPEATVLVKNCPVVKQGTTAPVDEAGTNVATTTAWYRNLRVSWFDFGGIDVPTTANRMPKEPVYVLQRIDEAAPIYEFATGIDLDGDAKLNASNNIFARGRREPGYTPLWFPVYVRVTADYLSIDNSTATPGLTDEDQFYDRDTKAVFSPAIAPLVEQPQLLINCPFQERPGAL